MFIIFTLIAIVLLISLYDFFTAKNWQQVTSDVRNETVFKNRNKNYGAYVMRKDYNKRMLLILSGMVVSMGAAYGTFMVVKSTPKVAIEVPTTEFDTIPLMLEKDKNEPEIIKIEKNETPASPEKMNEFRELVVSDTPEKDPQIIIDPETRSGDKKVIGDDEEHFTPPFDTTGMGRKSTAIELDIKDEPLMDVDEKAEYPGGRPKLMEFLSNNIRYPELAKELGIQGKSYFQFVVNKKGEISKIQIIRGVVDCPECDAEAKRVISKMPIWKPARVKGKPVDSYFQMPINFVLQ